MNCKIRSWDLIFRTRWRTATAALAMAFVFALTVALTQSVQAQTFNVIHTFTGSDGVPPPPV